MALCYALLFVLRITRLLGRNSGQHETYGYNIGRTFGIWWHVCAQLL